MLTGIKLHHCLYLFYNPKLLFWLALDLNLQISTHHMLWTWKVFVLTMSNSPSCIAILLGFMYCSLPVFGNLWWYSSVWVHADLLEVIVLRTSCTSLPKGQVSSWLVYHAIVLTFSWLQFVSSSFSYHVASCIFHVKLFVSNYYLN